MDYTPKTTTSKKSIIFYCSGQMEDYSPQFAGKLLKSENTLLKPIYASKLRALYKKMDLSHQNDSVIKVANELKNSLLSNYPYYFYIAYSNNYPDIYTSIQASINDGCGNIQILNYSYNKLTLSKELATQFKNHNISVEITPSVYSSLNFPSAIAHTIEASSQKNDGILLLSDTDEVTESIRNLLVANGYAKENIIISPKIATNIEAACNYFSGKQIKNIFYINLTSDNFDYTTELLVQRLSKKHSSAFKLSGINSWGYDKFLVRAALEVLRNKH